MKNLKKIIAGVIAASFMFSFAACKTETGETVPTGPDGLPNPTTIDLSSYTFDTVYGSQLNNYLNRQYYFDGEPIPVAESNFYYIDAFLVLNDYAMYGYYATTPEGFIDLSAAASSADGSNAYSTMGEFFIEYSERTLESTYVILAKCREEGITLSAETEAEIDATIDNLRVTNAEPAGITMEEYLQKFYGEACTVEAFRQIICNYKLADLYTEHFMENYEYEQVPNVRYVLFSAPEGSDEATLANAEQMANDLLEASTDLEQLELQGALAYTNGDSLQSSILPVERGHMVPAFEEWAYDESREEGDIEVIYAPEYGYFVVGYAGLTDIPEDSKEDIAVEALGDAVTEEIEAGLHTFYTNDPYTPAEPIAVVTDPATGMIITPTAAPSGFAGQSTVVRVLTIVGGAAALGLIAYAVNRLLKKDKDDEGEVLEAKSDDLED